MISPTSTAENPNELTATPVAEAASVPSVPSDDAPSGSGLTGPRLGGMLVAVLALLTAVAPMSIDMYLPGFPAIAADLGTSASGVQITMTTFLAGLAIGQLFIGPLSDGLGRRKPLLAGIVLFLIASVLCALAPNATALAFARFLQGLGGAAGLVIARAVVADGARGPAAAKLLGVLTIMSVIAPVVGPLVGGAVIAGAGWRAVFWVLAGVSVLMLVGALVWVRETLPAEARTRGGIAQTLASARVVLANRTYTGYLLTFCLGFAGLFAYIAASPFVVQNILGKSEAQFSLIFAGNAVAITATSALAAALAGKVSYRLVIGIGLAVNIVAAVGLLASALSGVPGVLTLVLFGVFQASLGLVFGHATTLALAQTEQHAGTGSAFLGFGQFLLAALVSPLVGIAGEGSALPMAIVMVVCAVLAAASFLAVPRTPRPNSRVGLDRDSFEA